MKDKRFTIKGEVEVFPQEGGWHFIRVPNEYTEMSRDFADRGLVPIIASVGESEWKTSLLPMGDGTHFIALNAKVRKKESIDLGDIIEVCFKFSM